MADIPWWRDKVIWFNAAAIVVFVLFWHYFEPSRWTLIAAVLFALVNILLRVYVSGHIRINSLCADLNEGETEKRLRHTRAIRDFIKRGQEHE